MEDEYDSKRHTYIEEILRQVSTQSALIAGFSFAGLTVDITAKEDFLRAAFISCLALTIVLEISALFLSGVLLFVSKISNLGDEKWDSTFTMSWLSYLFGLLTFLLSLPLLIWIKLPFLGLPISLVTVVLGGFLIWQLKKIAAKTGPE
jgi:predicted ferric reductase